VSFVAKNESAIVAVAKMKPLGKIFEYLFKFSSLVFGGGPLEDAIPILPL
jgi:hypothetical protein